MLPSTGRPFGPGGSLWVDTALHPQEALDGGGELLYLLVGVLAFLYGLPDAVLDVVLEQDGANLLKRRDDAGNLGEDGHAVGLLVHHPLHAPHLALYPLEVVLEQLLLRLCYTPLPYKSMHVYCGGVSNPADNCWKFVPLLIESSAIRLGFTVIRFPSCKQSLQNQGVHASRRHPNRAR